MLPKDPFMLLSLVNTGLRDGKYDSLEALALANGADAQSIIDTLSKVGYRYDEERRTFVVDKRA